MMKSDSLGISEMKEVVKLILISQAIMVGIIQAGLTVFYTLPVHAALALKGKVVVLQEGVNFLLKIKHLFSN